MYEVPSAACAVIGWGPGASERVGVLVPVLSPER